MIVSDDEPKEKWDCESILSTYSTLYNHPRTITDPPRRKKIAVNPRTGIPVDYEAGGLTRKALAQHDLDSSAEKSKRSVVKIMFLLEIIGPSVRNVSGTMICYSNFLCNENTFLISDGQLDTETLITSMSAISFRPAGETPEERRFRKKALKELRRVSPLSVVFSIN